MSFGQVSANQLRFAIESTFGTPPGGNFQNVPAIGWNFEHSNQFVQSGRINPTREPGDQIRVGAEVNATIDFELMVGAWDAFMEGVMMNAFQTELAITANAITVTGAATFLATWTSTGNPFVNVRPGDWLRTREDTATSSFTNATNRGAVKVATKTSDNVITVIVTNGTVVVNETTAGTVRISGRRLVFGPTLRSYHFEEHLDLATDNYGQWAGMAFSGMSLTVEPGQIISGNFSLLGKNGGISRSSIGGTPVAASTASPLNAIDHPDWVRIWSAINGGPAANNIAPNQLTVNIANPLAARPQIGVFGPVGLRLGRGAVTGSLKMYYHDEGIGTMPFDLMDAAIDALGGFGIYTIINDELSANTSTKYVVQISNPKFTRGSVPSPNNDADLELTLNYSSQVDPLHTNGASNAPTSFSIHKLIYPA